MNKQDRKSRFTEIMTSVELLPEIDMDDNQDAPDEAQEWILPNLTEGFDDPLLRNAILCQSMRGDEQFRFKIIALMTNSALKEVSKAIEDEQMLNESVVDALSVALNLLWADGMGGNVFGMGAMLYSTCMRFDIELPELATAVLRPNKNVSRFGSLDPNSILEGTVGIDDVKRVASEGE